MIFSLSPGHLVSLSQKLCGESSRVKRDLAIFYLPNNENNGARERKEDTMYKRLISLTEPVNERVHPVGNPFLNHIRDSYTTGANPHYP